MTTSEWAVSDSTVSANASASKAAVSGSSHVVTGIAATVDGSGNSNVQLKFGATVVFRAKIAGGGSLFIPFKGIRASDNEAVEVVATDPGGSLTVTASIVGYTIGG